MIPNDSREQATALVTVCTAMQALPLENLPRIAAVMSHFGSSRYVRLQLGTTPDIADGLISWAESVQATEVRAHWSHEQPGSGDRHIGVTVRGALGGVGVEVWTYLDRHDVDDLDGAGVLLGLEPDQRSGESVPVSLIGLSMLRRPTEAVAS